MRLSTVKFEKEGFHAQDEVFVREGGKIKMDGASENLPRNGSLLRRGQEVKRVQQLLYRWRHTMVPLALIQNDNAQFFNQVTKLPGSAKAERRSAQARRAVRRRLERLVIRDLERILPLLTRAALASLYSQKRHQFR